MQLTLLNTVQTLTRVDHQTHRRYAFQVPAACQELQIHIRYAPKYLSVDESHKRFAEALQRQRMDLARRVGEPLIATWAEALVLAAGTARVPNLLTISLDD